MSDNTIIALISRIQQETGIVLSRETDRSRIKRYLDNGGEVPSSPAEPLPVALINLITTNETYFERESHHFDRLIDEIIPQLNSSHSAEPIRILTAPCSSGEESYTVALRLALASKTFSRPIEIVGIDISPEMIEKARRGVYSKRSTHALSKEVLERFFICEGDNFRIIPPQGISIRFITGNIFDDALWRELGDFEVIFSRNMMIYFDSATNRELLLRFKKHLRGYLILGHADDHLNAKEFFTPLRGERGMIYCS